MTITSKISCLSLVLVLGVSVGTGLMAYQASDAALLYQERQSVGVTAKRQEVQLIKSIRSVENDARYLALMPALVRLANSQGALAQVSRSVQSPDSPNSPFETNWHHQLKASFDALLSTREGYVQVQLIDTRRDGRSIVRATRSGINALAGLTGHVLARERVEWFRQANRNILNDSPLSWVEFGRGDPGSDAAPILRTAVLVLSSDGQPFGTVVIDVDLRSLLASAAEPTREFTSSYWAAPSGTIIHASLHANEASQQQAANIQELFPELAIAFDSPSVETFFESYARHPNSVLHMRKVFFDPHDSARFLVVVVESANVTYAKVFEHVLPKTIAIPLTGLTLAAGFALYCSRRFLLPLRQLAEAAPQAIVEDDQAPTRSQRKSEVDVLSNALGDLTVRLDERARAAEESHQRIRTILETAGEAIITIDVHARVTSFNAAAAAMFDYSPEEVLGVNVSIFMPPREARAHDLNIERYLRTGERHIIGFRREVEGVRRNGKCFPLSLAVSESGKPGDPYHGFTAIIRDLTEHQRLIAEIRANQFDLIESYRQVEREKERAEAANRAKSELFSNMTHEMRSPLHAILATAELGMSRIDIWSRTKQLKNLGNLHAGAQRLLALSNALLDLSKLEAGMVEYSMDEHDLHHLALEVHEGLKTVMGQKTLSLRFAHADISTLATCCASNLSRVFENLLANATKFSPEGGVIEIRFSETELELGDETRPAISVSISDQGVGIPVDEIDSVFDKFVQSSRTKTGAGGTGLGLAICREIVKAHGGVIRASNNPDRGSTFTFDIPRDQSA